MATRRPAVIISGKVKACPAGDVLDSACLGSSSGGFSVGDIKHAAYSVAPSNWLLADGSLLNRVTYSVLFGAIGTTYGVGDGSTTFALPDLRGRIPLGSGSGTGLTARTLGSSGGEEAHLLSTDEMPSHSHTITDPGHIHTATPVAHTHSASIAAHTHVVTDPTHNHTWTASGSHTHQILASGNYFLQTINNSNGQVYVSSTSNSQTPLYKGPTNCVATTATGTNTAVSTGITIASATPTPTIGNATPGITISSGTTGITVATNGSGSTHNTMSPFLALSAFIKYQ